MQMRFVILSLLNEYDDNDDFVHVRSLSTCYGCDMQTHVSDTLSRAKVKVTQADSINDAVLLISCEFLSLRIIILFLRCHSQSFRGQCQPCLTAVAKIPFYSQCVWTPTFAVYEQHLGCTGCPKK